MTPPFDACERNHNRRPVVESILAKHCSNSFLLSDSFTTRHSQNAQTKNESRHQNGYVRANRSPMYSLRAVGRLYWRWAARIRDGCRWNAPPRSVSPLNFSSMTLSVSRSGLTPPSSGYLLPRL